MRAGAAACEESRASHQGLAEGYDRLIVAARSDGGPADADSAPADLQVPLPRT